MDHTMYACISNACAAPGAAMATPKWVQVPRPCRCRSRTGLASTPARCSSLSEIRRSANYQAPNNSWNYGLSEMTTNGSSIPKIDLGGGGGGDEAAVRSAVMDALRTHGWFEAVTDGPDELHAAVLGAGGALETLHSLPVSTKARSSNHMPHRGYLSLPGFAYESSVIMEPLSLDSVRAFADLMWPHTGNAAFCESIHAYVEKAEVLISVVRRMVLQSVGATDKYIENLAKETSFKLRLTAYAPPGTAEGRLGAYAHRDTSYLTILSQNDIDGIELMLEDGEGGWVRPALSPGSFLVLAGEMLRALTNDQVVSPLHRVVVAGHKTRYSAILFAAPRDDFLVQAVDKAVDAHHPPIFRPFKYRDYYVFCYNTENNERRPDNLDAFALLSRSDQ